MNTIDLISHYADLLIAQYRDLPRATGTIRALVARIIADQIVGSVNTAFDLDTAVGAQLDIIGAYHGVQRNIVGIAITRDYFALVPYADPTPDSYAGFYVYGDTPVNNFETYSDANTSLFSITDEEMRQLIKLKIRQHMSSHSLADIDDIMHTFFGDGVTVTETAPMELTYAFDPAITDALPKLAVYTNSLPRPSGVSITVTGVAL